MFLRKCVENRLACSVSCFIPVYDVPLKHKFQLLGKSKLCIYSLDTVLVGDTKVANES